MKRRVTALLAGLCLALGLITTVTAPSQATPAVSTSVQNLPEPDSCHYDADLLVTMNGCKFWTGKTICVDGSDINGAYYRVAYIAQAWNNAVDWADKFALDYSDDCVADGYTPSTRMVIAGHHGGTSGTCLVNSSATRVLGANFERWTNGPAMSINMDRAECVSGQVRRDHAVSLAIGVLMGGQALWSSGWAGRVMYTPDYSLVAIPTAADGEVMRQIYGGGYGS